MQYHLEATIYSSAWNFEKKTLFERRNLFVNISVLMFFE